MRGLEIVWTRSNHYRENGMPTEDRSTWSDDRVKKDHAMWTEIIGSGRVLTKDQQDRVDKTRDEVDKRGIIPVSGQG